MEKIRKGRVISNKMDKTVVVAVESRRKHPRYRKIVKHTAKFMAHDELNTCGVDDIVKIIETRPLSRRKRWRIIEIITEGETAKIQPTQSNLETRDDSEGDEA